MANTDASGSPLCRTCGTPMRPAGSCFVCESCGSTTAFPTDDQNVITVGACINGRVAIEFTGPLSKYIEGLKRYVQQVKDVRGNAYVSGESTIVANLGSRVSPEQAQEARNRIKGRCGDYLGDVTGLLVNVGNKSDRVYLQEDVPPAVA